MKKIVILKKEIKIGDKEIPIVFKNERRKNLVGILHLPEREERKKLPLVIICHGFDGTKTNKKFIELGRCLQKEGIAVFRFDFEGCGDSEGEFSETTIKKESSDVNSALKKVLKTINVDSEKIALLGYSLGSVVAALFIKDFKAPIKTLVFWTQAFNQKELFKIWHTKEEIKNWEKTGFLIKADKKMGRKYLEENKEKDWSFLLSEMPKIPILLIQGDKDEDTPLELSEKLTEIRKDIKLEILAGISHKLSDFTFRRKLIKLTVAWLKKYL